MYNKKKVVTPTYQQIAVDIATNIANGKYEIGETISGRSTLAGQYSVSPETIRRAVYILQDVGILKTKIGSGIEVISVENAFKFIEHFQEVKDINEMHTNIVGRVEKHKEEYNSLLAEINNLLEVTERYSEANPFVPYIIQINKKMCNAGKTSSDLNFWQNTGATIIAIKRENKIIISPGPYASFKEGDILYFIGKPECFERVKKLLDDD